jgi:rhodanese-related sulfurtransferase
MASSPRTLSEPGGTGEISREELLRRLRDPALIVADVLPNSSYSSEHIPGAISLPLAELAAKAPSLLPDHAREIAVYCASFT